MKVNYLFLLLGIFLFSCQPKKEAYVCTPCKLSCDELTFYEPGTCPHCKMDLIRKSELRYEKELILNEVRLEEGSGVFVVDGGEGAKEKRIKVYYHRPVNFDADSKILLVIPGAGRNGDSYRDAWIEESEKFNVLVLSPMYSEEDYDFGDYHMCGLMSDPNIEQSVKFIEGTNIARLNEDQFSFELNTDTERWIFNDFDRIFNLVVSELRSSQTQYDIFGHSAGGQILHRLVVFNASSSANRILASNSGFYTLPDPETELPFGTKGTGVEEQSFPSIFSKKLILFIGELDNESETGGTMLRSKTADMQGTHRLERGKFFYNYAKSITGNSGYELNWELVIIKGVGHNHRKMGDAAGNYLYGDLMN